MRITASLTFVQRLIKAPRQLDRYFWRCLTHKMPSPRILWSEEIEITAFTEKKIVTKDCRNVWCMQLQLASNECLKESIVAVPLGGRTIRPKELKNLSYLNLRGPISTNSPVTVPLTWLEACTKGYRESHMVAPLVAKYCNWALLIHSRLSL